MNRLPLRKIDLLVLGEFIPFFLMGVAAFTLLMVAVLLFRPMMNYITTYHLSVTQVGIFFILALPQTIAYTFPMAVLFATLLAFGRMSDSSEITALRAGGIGFFRIVLPALIFTWFVVLGTFILNETVAPQSTRTSKEFIQNAIIDKGISLEETNISYMDQDAGWLFAAASADGNIFYDVKWWDFSRPGNITLYTADEGVWMMGKWEFRNAHVIHLGIGNGNGIANNGDSGDPASENNEEDDFNHRGNVVRSMVSPTLEMEIARTPSDILSGENRDPDEMSLQELQVFLASAELSGRSENYLRKIQGTYSMKIATPFASIVFILLAAPLGLVPTRSSNTVGIGLAMLLVFAYYMLTTFSINIAERGILIPVIAAWLPNIVFLIAGIFLNARFHIRSA